MQILYNAFLLESCYRRIYRNIRIDYFYKVITKFQNVIGIQEVHYDNDVIIAVQERSSVNERDASQLQESRVILADNKLLQR